MNRRHGYQKQTDPLSAVRTGKEGSSLVELLVAVAIFAFMAVAIYTAGFSVLRHSQTVTITMAAHTYAKEGLEEAISFGYGTLSGAGESIMQQDIPTPYNVTLTRTRNIIWHAADKSTSTAPVDGGYAEVVVRVTWPVPRTSLTASTAISSLIF